MRVIYELNGISQVGQKVLDTRDGIIVECLTTCVEPKYHEIISNHKMDKDYNYADKVVTSLDEINRYYDDRIQSRLTENRIDEDRRKRAIKQFNEYLNK